MTRVLGLILLSFYFVPTSWATNLTCADLQKAFNADMMNLSESPCSSGDCRDRLLEQLRFTVRLFTGNSAADHKHSLQLTADYDPRFLIYSVGNREYEAVNIELLGHPLVALFDRGTLNYAGIQIAAGEIFVNSAPCATKFKPVINSLRRKNICQAVVSNLKSKKPQLKYEVANCEATSQGSRLDVFIDEFNGVSMKMRVQRHLKDFGGGYFACDIRMDRRDSMVQSLNCMVR